MTEMGALKETGEKAKIHVVGIPPGHRLPPEEETRLLVSKADLLVGREEFLTPWPEKPSIKLDRHWEKAVVQAEKLRSQGSLVVFLANGDPLFFGIGSTLLRRLGPQKVSIHPAVSSMQLAFARVGDSWEEARFFSAHGRPLREVAYGVASCTKSCVLTSGPEQPSLLARALLSHGLRDVEVFLCEDLGFPEEKVTALTLEELAERECSPLNLLVFRMRRNEEDGRGHVACLLGLPDEAFRRPPGREGMITKQELRVITLSRLRLRQGDVLWDVGAGVGSVAVEAARLMGGTGKVFAVEKDPQRLEVLCENASTLAPPNLEVIAGEAPRALHSLPPPDAVFVGGSGGKLEEILEHCCFRLKPGGRLAAHFACPERAFLAKRTLERMGLRGDLFLFQGARLRGFGGGEMFEALNPVFVVSGSKE